jgi:hypothetical protein
VIGWYIHHHGYGHLTRFLAVQPHLAASVTVFSSLPAPTDLPEAVTWTQLPPDDGPFERHGARRLPHASEPTAGGALHWAPLGHPGHRARLAAIADAAVRHDLDAFVVDVSAEVTAFVRLLGVPTVVVTQPGERSDAPHRLAYALADRVLAPWAEGVLPAPAADPRKVRFTGGISRFDGLPGGRRRERRVLFLGRTLADAALAQATALLGAAGWRHDVIGTGAGDRRDPWSLLRGAAVVVSAAGQNSVADLAAAGARAVVVPQERPFDEQETTAAALERLGLAAVCPPDDAPGLVARVTAAAAASAPDWSPWAVGGAAARAAAVIGEVG